MLNISETKKRSLNKKNIAAALVNPETFATVIHAVALVMYGDDIYEDPPLSTFLKLKEDFGVQTCEEVENKFQAILLATDTDDFFEDSVVFRHIVLTLLDGDPQFENAAQLNVIELFWATYEVTLNREEEGELSDEIREMIKREIDDEASDEFDEGTKPNYVLKAISEYRKELGQQLRATGFSDFQLPPAGA